MKSHRILRVTGGRVAIQKTKNARLSDEAIDREIRALAKEIDLSRVVFHFKRLGRASRAGMAYPGIPWIANMDGLRRGQWSYLVVVTDHQHWIRTLAHECKHIEQFRSRGVKASELPARAFADWWTKKRATEAAL